VSVTVNVSGMNQELGRPVTATTSLAQSDGETVVFTAPTTGSCFVTLNIANRQERSRFSIRLALSESSTAQSSDWLVYDTEIEPGGVLERTGLVLAPDQTLIASVTEEAIPLVFDQIKITASDAASSDFFGFSVAVGDGRIVVGAYGDDDAGLINPGSAYIFDLNGNQLAKITASDAAGNDNFGQSVAIGDNRIVVGSPSDDSGTGSAYVFDLDGNELTKITASDGAASDLFGYAVAVGDGRIVVGALFDDDAGNTSGSAYVFDLDGNELAKITASDAAAGDEFGTSVAVGDGRIVVGALFDDDNGTDSGSAYVFDLDGNELAKITASDGAAIDNFGVSVAVGSNRIVVGAWRDDFNSGSAYVFDLDGTQLSKITASDGASNDLFGQSVAVGSGRIVVGAYRDDDAGSSSGSAYVFDLNGNELSKITASDGNAGDFFGYAVALGSGIIVVGARGDDDPTSSGSAYIFTEQ